jgi:hypothetical protein
MVASTASRAARRKEEAVPSPGGRRSRGPAPRRRRPAGGRPGQQPRGVRGAQPLLTPKDVAPVRHTVERRGAVWLLYASRFPRWALAALAAALFLAALLAPGVAGGVAAAVIAAPLAWLAYVTWPAVAPTGRLLRVLVIAALVAIAVVKLI